MTTQTAPRPSGSSFVNVGERTNVTGSARVHEADPCGRCIPRRVDVAREQVANGAQIIDVNMDEGLLDCEDGDGARSST